MSNAALTTRQKGILDRLKDPDFHVNVAETLGSYMTPKRWCEMAINYVRKDKTGKLQSCDPVSFFACAKRVAELRLNLDGRDAYLIPYGAECTLIISVHGLKKLVLRTGKVARIYEAIIRENDIFEHDMGVILKHTYKLGPSRGPISGAYFLIEYTNGAKSAEIMEIAQIEAIRKRSPSEMNGRPGPWKTDYEEMVLKTVARRGCKKQEWGFELLEQVADDDEVIDVEQVPAARAALPNLFMQRLTTPAPEPEPEPIPEPAAEAPQPPAAAPTPAKAVKTAPAPQSAPLPTVAQPRDHLAGIRARLAKEGIAESDFAGFQGVGELAALDTSELAKIVLNLDKEIDEYQKSKQ